MKQLIYFCFMLAFAFSCSSDEPPIINDPPKEEAIPPIDLDLSEILERGYINAAVDYSSTTYFVYRGEIMGFEYEILKMLEEYFKIKVNIIVLPITIGLLQFGQMKLTLGKNAKSQPTDGPMPMMNKTMMYFMPIMIAVFTASLPAAVGFYWGTSTLFGIGQQLFVNKSKD